MGVIMKTDGSFAALKIMFYDELPQSRVAAGLANNSARPLWANFPD